MHIVGTTVLTPIFWTLCCSEILDCPFVEKIEHKHKVFRRKFLIWIVKSTCQKTQYLQKIKQILVYSRKL